MSREKVREHRRGAGNVGSAGAHTGLEYPAHLLILGVYDCFYMHFAS